MIRNDLLNKLQLLIKTSVPPVTALSRTPLLETNWMPGQRLPATVLASLPNGRFQVQVNEFTLDLNLPRGIQAGEQIELTYVTNQPRLTFTLARGVSAEPIANTPADARPQVTLSDSVRALGALLQTIAEKTDARVASPSVTAPLLAAAPASPQALALTLRDTLSQSGLFYESHQAQWVAGERPLAELLREPQGKLSALHAEAATERAALSMLTEGGFNPSAARTSFHPDSVALVQQQLQTLESNQLIWQGQVWQGQSMEWRVDERNAREKNATDADAPQWQTSLRLQLPNLGDIGATLTFHAKGIRVNLTAADATTTDSMISTQEKLRDSMQDAGLRVISILVERDEKT
jgi:hypothetical protein